ncbi:MAG: hypothetical protein PUP92_35080, partial [Rhizonema sp. PD38]|nr:hypothetical protein [Rhizonema sp. PD38]
MEDSHPVDFARSSLDAKSAGEPLWLVIFERRLDEAARIWDENSRPEGNLWRTPDLDLLTKYYGRASDNMTPLQVEFFRASVDAQSALK